MNPTGNAHVLAIVHVLLVEVAPRWRAEIDADTRAALDPGLRAAVAVVTAWLADLHHDSEAALQSCRLVETLRRALVCSVCRGRVCVPEDAHQPCWVEVSPHDMAMVETVRELTETLDLLRGTTLAADFDAHRESFLAQAISLAARAAQGRRGRRAAR